MLIRQRESYVIYKLHLHFEVQWVGFTSVILSSPQVTLIPYLLIMIWGYYLRSFKDLRFQHLRLPLLLTAIHLQGASIVSLSIRCGAHHPEQSNTLQLYCKEQLNVTLSYAPLC